jgi:hypothetical protein
MAIMLQEPYLSWLKTKVGANVDDNTRFTLTVSAATATGQEDVKVEFDLVWFILIYVNDIEQMKLQVVQLLLNDPKCLAKFQATLDNQSVKRLIAEYLLFNFTILDSLKAYIDFNKLNVPINFISHALFIKRSENIDTQEINIDRLKIVNAVLDTGFILPPNSPAHVEGAVIRKVLSMSEVQNKFKTANRLLHVGFSMFSDNILNNTEVAIILLDGRRDPDCLAIIKENAEQLKNVKVQAEGTDEKTNIADYYYWVKEDMDTVRFLKEELAIVISPTTK